MIRNLKERKCFLSSKDCKRNLYSYWAKEEQSFWCEQGKEPLHLNEGVCMGSNPVRIVMLYQLTRRG